MADARRSGVDQDVRPGVFFPSRRAPPARRGAGAHERRRGRALRHRARSGGEIDGHLPLRQLRTLDQMLADGLAQRRFVTALLTVFAGLATLLASIGIYGVMAYLVGRRSAGDRASASRSARGRGGRSCGRCCARGWSRPAPGSRSARSGAVALAGLCASQLFGVAPSDPTTFAGVAGC
jgi:hypothetical protein